ncbi:MAG: DUF1893 domain-containing protein [Muribaculaceae bacterium]|nr:DUF1893 domain-containing protein [Muribaculaceae bacterium]
MLRKLKNILHAEGCSLVVGNANKVETFRQRGVKDLLQLLHNAPQTLSGASVADKVVGKGAAALMALGGVKELYTAVISTPALELMRNSGIAVEFDTETPAIINRAGTGPCPVEALCRDCRTPEECLPLIENFVTNLPH